MSHIDLHSHSTASDGTDSPSEMANLVKRAGLSAWSLTDHDTVAGLEEASRVSAEHGIDFINGIEISAEFPYPGTLHLLGYGVNPKVDSIKDLTGKLLEGRDNRNPKIIKKLQELNVAITMEEVEKEAGKDANPEAVVGRPHIAAILVRKGYVGSIKEAFNKYLAQGGLAYFDKERLAPRRAIELIRESKGIPVLAHPVQLRLPNDAELGTVIKNLVDLGLGGIEVIHSDHTRDHEQKYEQLAKKYGLLCTGGSDFHGAKKAGIQLGFANGKRIPREYFDRLKDRLKK
jgi:3',5'-nucleoside bisphosphate phosphatase